MLSIKNMQEKCKKFLHDHYNEDVKINIFILTSTGSPLTKIKKKHIIKIFDLKTKVTFGKSWNKCFTEWKKKHRQHIKDNYSIEDYDV